MSEEFGAEIYRQLMMKAFDQCIPLYGLIELTYRCNQRCIHCYIDPAARAKHRTENGAEMTQAEIYGVLDQMADLGCLQLTLTGGEILVRPDFFAIAEYAVRKSFVLRLFTNGTLITPEVADRMRDLRPLSVELSVYATKAEIHDQITQVPDSWARTMRGAELLRERGVYLVLKSPLTHRNAAELDGLYRLAKEFDASFRYDLTIVPRKDGSREPVALRLTDDDLRAIFHWQIITRQKDDHEQMPLEKRTREKPRAEEYPCGAGRTGLVISPSGGVYPCMDILLEAGNVLERPLKDIWQSSAVLERVRALRIADLTICSQCDMLSSCRRCSGLALQEEGDILGPSAWACRMSKLYQEVVHEQAEIV